MKRLAGNYKKNTDNITKQFFYYLVSSSEKIRKDSYTKNNIRDKRSRFTNTCGSQDKENRGRGAAFLGRCSKLRIRPSHKFRKLPRNPGTLGQSRAQKKRCQMRSQIIEYPETRAGTPEEIGLYQKARSWGNNWRKCSVDFGASSRKCRAEKTSALLKNVRYIEKLNRGTLNNEAQSSSISLKVQYAWNTPRKTKKLSDENHDRHQEKYGTRSRLADQPEVGPD